MSRLCPTIDSYTASAVEFLKNVDTVDVEHVLTGSEPVLFVVGYGKNITYRTQIRPKNNRGDGFSRFLLYHGNLITSEIYSLMGFDYLEIKIKLKISQETKIIKYENIKEGWFKFPFPIVDNLNAKISFKFLLKNDRIDKNFIMLKNHKFRYEEHIEFSRLVDSFPLWKI